MTVFRMNDKPKQNTIQISTQRLSAWIEFFIRYWPLCLLNGGSSLSLPSMLFHCLYHDKFAQTSSSDKTTIQSWIGLPIWWASRRRLNDRGCISYLNKFLIFCLYYVHKIFRTEEFFVVSSFENNLIKTTSLAIASVIQNWSQVKSEYSSRFEQMVYKNRISNIW